MRHSDSKIKGGKVFIQEPPKKSFLFSNKTSIQKGVKIMKTELSNTSDFDLLASLTDIKKQLSADDFNGFLSELDGYIDFLQYFNSFAAERIAPLQSLPTYSLYCELWSGTLDIFAEVSVSLDENKELLSFLESFLADEISRALLKNNGV